MTRMSKWTALAVTVIALVSLTTACGGSDNEVATDATTAATTEAATTAVAEAIEAPADGGKVKKLAFFGFWKSNSFTQAFAAAVQSETEKLGIEYLDLTGPAYDGVDR